MKLLIEESVLRQALEYMGRTIPPGPSASRQGLDAITALRTALDAADKVEPFAWIVPEFGFLFPTKNAATSYLRNIESSDTPTPLYTHPAPAVSEIPAGATHYQPHQKTYYKRVSATEWYLWSCTGNGWIESKGTSDSAEWVMLNPVAAPTPPTNTASELREAARAVVNVYRNWNKLQPEIDRLRKAL